MVCACLAGGFFATGGRGFDVVFLARFLVVEAIDKDRDAAELFFMPGGCWRQGMLPPEQIQLRVKSKERGVMGWTTWSRAKEAKEARFVE